MLEHTWPPINTWMLAIMYVCCLLNHTASHRLHWLVPLKQLTGVTPDISPLLRFQWYTPVYYKQSNVKLPSDAHEKGTFCWYCWTYWTYYDIQYTYWWYPQQHILLQYMICSWPSAPNLRLDWSDGEYKDRTHIYKKEQVTLPDLEYDTYVEIIKSANYLRQDKTMMVIAPENMVGRSFLSNTTDNETSDNG